MKVYCVVTVSNHETYELSDNVDVEVYKEKEAAEVTKKDETVSF